MNSPKRQNSESCRLTFLRYRKRKRPGLKLDDEEVDDTELKPRKSAKQEETATPSAEPAKPSVPTQKPKTDIDDLWASLNGGSSNNTLSTAQSKPSNSEVDELWAALSGGKSSSTSIAQPKATTSPSAAPSKLSAPSTTPSSSLAAELSSIESKKADTVIIVEKFDFAGETVEIKKQVAANSTAAQKQNAPPVKSTGLSSMLEQMKGKKKMTSLDKSQHDWDGFRTASGITDELNQNKKDGYVERCAVR